MRRARLYRAMTTPTWFGRAPLHAAAISFCVLHREPDAFDRAIDLRITRLRRKVEADAAHPEAIRTVRGVGYMFVPPKS